LLSPVDAVIGVPRHSPGFHADTLFRGGPSLHLPLAHGLVTPAVLQRVRRNEGGADAAGKHTKLRPEEEDPQLREFLEVMKPRHKGKLWSNDDTLGFEHMVRR
jgi:hypothetical protein